MTVLDLDPPGDSNALVLSIGIAAPGDGSVGAHLQFTSIANKNRALEAEDSVLVFLDGVLVHGATSESDNYPPTMEQWVVLAEYVPSGRHHANVVVVRRDGSLRACSSAVFHIHDQSVVQMMDSVLQESESCQTMAVWIGWPIKQVPAVAVHGRGLREAVTLDVHVMFGRPLTDTPRNTSLSISLNGIKVHSVTDFPLFVGQQHRLEWQGTLAIPQPVFTLLWSTATAASGAKPVGADGHDAIPVQVTVEVGGLYTATVETVLWVADANGARVSPFDGWKPEDAPHLLLAAQHQIEKAKAATAAPVCPQSPTASAAAWDAQCDSDSDAGDKGSETVARSLARASSAPQTIKEHVQRWQVPKWHNQDLSVSLLLDTDGERIGIHYALTAAVSARTGRPPSGPVDAVVVMDGQVVALRHCVRASDGLVMMPPLRRPGVFHVTVALFPIRHYNSTLAVSTFALVSQPPPPNLNSTAIFGVGGISRPLGRDPTRSLDADDSPASGLHEPDKPRMHDEQGVTGPLCSGCVASLYRTVFLNGNWYVSEPFTDQAWGLFNTMTERKVAAIIEAAVGGSVDSEAVAHSDRDESTPGSTPTWTGPGGRDAQGGRTGSVGGAGVSLIDVGANIGYFSMLVATLGRSVVAIEVDASCIHYLDTNLRINNLRDLVTVHHASAASPTTITAPDAYCPGGWAPRVQRVPAMAITDVPIGRPRLPVLKIDIDGPEMEALAPVLPWVRSSVDHLLIEVNPLLWGEARPVWTTALIGLIGGRLGGGGRPGEAFRCFVLDTTGDQAVWIVDVLGPAAHPVHVTIDVVTVGPPAAGSDSERGETVTPIDTIDVGDVWQVDGEELGRLLAQKTSAASGNNALMLWFVSPQLAGVHVASHGSDAAK